MGCNPLKELERALHDVYDAAEGLVSDLWDKVVVPALGEIFGLIGIDDETLVESLKSSSMLFGDNTEDVIRAATVRAVLTNVKEGGTFFGHYYKETRLTQLQLRQYHMYADRGKYIHGLPTAQISGGAVDFTIIEDSLKDAVGSQDAIRISSIMRNPTDREYYGNLLQVAPYYYLPWRNTLTYDDDLGISRDGWTMEDITYVPGNNTNDIDIAKRLDETIFWVEVPQLIPEGSPIRLNVKCNRSIPRGASITINLSYSGTAIDGTDYISVASTVMTQWMTSKEVIIETTTNVTTGDYKTVISTIDSIVNTNGALEKVTIHDTWNSITTGIVDTLYVAPIVRAIPALTDVKITDVINLPNYIKRHSLIVEYYIHIENPNFRYMVKLDVEWRYWIYEFITDAYPLITLDMNILTGLDMMPIAILRREKTWINVDKETEEYKTTKRLVEKIGLDIEDIITNASENPNIGDIDDMFINFAVCPNTTHETASKILWLEFYNIIEVHNIVSNHESYSSIFQEQDIDNAIVWTRHNHNHVIGVLASGQEYEHEIFIQEEEGHWEDEDSWQFWVIDVEAYTILTIRHQRTTYMYEELTIRDLSSMHAIAYDGHHKAAFHKLGDDQFTVPLSYHIVKQFSPLEQMELYQYILRIDSYGIVITHVDWYNTSSFLGLFKFAMIILAIWTAGQSLYWYQAVIQLIINYAILQIVIFIAEETGNAELAAIIGIIAAVVIGGGDFGSAFDFLSAEGLIQASTQFANNLTAAYDVESQMIGEDIKDLNTQYEARMAEIEERTPDEKIVTPEFLVSLDSVDTAMFPAIQAQYDFDLLFDYDRLISDYYDINLQTGVI